MTTPATPEPATVPAIGTSEIVSAVTLLASFLTLLFGKDWGLAAYAQGIAALALPIIPAFLALARALKHDSVTRANAAVTVAQLSQPAAAPAADPAPAAKPWLPWSTSQDAPVAPKSSGGGSPVASAPAEPATSPLSTGAPTPAPDPAPLQQTLVVDGHVYTLSDQTAP